MNFGITRVRENKPCQNFWNTLLRSYSRREAFEARRDTRHWQKKGIGRIHDRICRDDIQSLDSEIQNSYPPNTSNSNPTAQTELERYLEDTEIPENPVLLQKNRREISEIIEDLTPSRKKFNSRIKHAY